LRLNARAAEYGPMADATRARLAERFAAGNARLGEWLGRDLSGWSR
jgi:hypothetical protein